MSVLYVVLPIALLLLAGAIAAYAWAARRGQFDDLKTPAIRALHDDDLPHPNSPQRITGRTLGVLSFPALHRPTDQGAKARTERPD